MLNKKLKRKNIFLLSLIFLFICCTKLAANESQILQLSVDSKFTNRRMPCTIYLPKGYGGREHYSVWYGLNGFGSNEMMWIDTVGAAKTADEMINKGIIKPLIMVFPFTRNDSLKEVQSNLRKNGEFGEHNMDQFLYKELVPYIDSHFDTITSADGRYIGGFSMGGMIALRVAFHHSDIFSKVGGFSAAVTDKDYSGRQLEEWLYPNDNVDEIESITQFDMGKGFYNLRVYLDGGTINDPFFDGLQSLDKCLQEKGIKSEFHIFEGGHDISHAINDIKEYLVFFTS
jgi:enterochelin esterase-like enzyme